MKDNENEGRITYRVPFGDSHGKHYKSGRIQPIEVIEDWDLGFCLGNAIKYIGRAGHKLHNGLSVTQSTITDLEKARDYIDRHIERLRHGKIRNSS